MPQLYKWTVSIIAQQDGEHLFEYVELEQSILNQKYNKNIRYIIFYYDQGTGKNFIKKLVYNPHTKLNQFEKVRDWVKQDIYNKETLINFFQDYVLKDSTSTRNMVFLWGHGAGMGYFSAVQDEPYKSNFLSGFEENFDSLNKTQLINFNEDLNALAFFYSNFSFPANEDAFLDSFYTFFTKKYKVEEKYKLSFLNIQGTLRLFFRERLRLISVKDLAIIFQDSFAEENKIVDVLITLNCYTQTIETCYELKDNVGMLVAPQTIMPFAGWNYTNLFGYLENEEYTPNGLAQNLKVNFLCKYETEPFASQFKQRWPKFDPFLVSFSANILSEMSNLAGTLNVIAEILKKSLTSKLGSKYKGLHIVMGARERCEDITPSNNFDLVDLTHFLEECIFFVGEENAEISIVFSRFLSIKKKSIAAILQPAKLFQPLGSPKSSASPNFLSIFFPYRSGGGGKFSKFILENFYNDNSTSVCAFLNYKWDEFILSPEIPK